MRGAEGPQMSALLATVAGAYRAAEMRQERLQVLSIVANIFPLYVLQQFIPGLTQYMFTQARYYASISGAGVKTEPEHRSGSGCTQKSLWTALDFIASDMVSTPAPFGTMIMKLSSGDKEEIDLYIRQQCNETSINSTRVTWSKLNRWLTF